MSELREKVARVLFESACPNLDWQEWSRPPGLIKERYLKHADAVLALARPAIIEECARVADRIAANPPSNDARHIDWQAGVQDGAMESAASIRVLAEKP